MSIVVSNNKRLREAEKALGQQRSEQLNTWQRCYTQAVEDGDIERAAQAARMVRNKLLETSDREMTIDRMSLDTSGAIKFLASLKTIFSGAWATYRKALRDLPEQEGFPMNIAWPTPPSEQIGDEDGGE